MNKQLRISSNPLSKGKIYSDDPIIQAIFGVIYEQGVSLLSVEQAAGLNGSSYLSSMRAGMNPRLSTVHKIVAALGYKLVLQRLD